MSSESKEQAEWNRKAEIQNTKTFIATFDREPKDYQEVKEWVDGLIAESEKYPLPKETIEQYDALGLLHDGYKIVGYVAR